MHHYQDLIKLFNDTFAKSENTRLVKGDSEPVYLPASIDCEYHQVVFAHGFYASALHEIAHWCIAGKARRQLEDYGYWYCPDGRNINEQAEFEKVELKPQAIECAFSMAAGFAFKVSTDNLHGAEVDRESFVLRVNQQLSDLKRHGFPPRAAQFLQVLESFYNAYEINPSVVMQVDEAVV